MRCTHVLRQCLTGDCHVVAQFGFARGPMQETAAYLLVVDITLWLLFVGACATRIL